MRTAVLSLIVVGMTAMGSGLSAQISKTTWDGVFTEAQATSGAAGYAQLCAPCHGPSLDGTGEAAALKGGQFMSSWNGLTVGDLFNRIRTTMPFDRPGSLTRDQVTQITAYLLQANGFRAGTSQLFNRSEMLATIGIVAQRPAGSTAAPPAAATPTAGTAMAGVPVSAADWEAQEREIAKKTWPEVDMTLPQNAYPNPFSSNAHFLKLPPGRHMGSTSAVATDSKGNIWVADRCGASSCADSKLDPIMEFDKNGNFIKAFGGGLLSFPHGLYIDAGDNLWLADGTAAHGKGATVTKFSPEGKVLLTIGQPGVAKDGDDTLLEPNAVIVSPDGTIFIASGHDVGIYNIKKFDRTGKLLERWGTAGQAPGQLNAPHALAMDSQGRLFVADRGNNRIQIYDQDGKLLDSWTQFGRPSGIYIDGNDTLYSTDSESRIPPAYGHHPDWARGIRIGSAKTGKVEYFIPDTYPKPNVTATSGAEGIWADASGTVWGAEVLHGAVVRYSRER